MNFLIHRLIHFFTFGATMFFAAGAVADVSVAETVPIGVTDGADNPDAPEADTTTDGSDTQTDDTKAAPEDGTQPDKQLAQDSKLLPADVRNHIAKLREAAKTDHTQAKVADQIQGAFTKQANFYKEFPQGMKEAREYKQLVTELGGKEGLQTFEQEKAEWREIDERYLAADPKFVEDMATVNPDSFAKILPYADAQWVKVDPAGRDHHMAGVMMDTLAGMQITTDLYLAKQMLTAGNPQEAAKFLEKVDKSIQNLNKIATTAPAKRVETKTGPDDKETQFQQKETQLFEKEVGLDVEPRCETLMQKELKPFLKGVEMTERNQKVFKREVMQELRNLADKDQNFKTNFLRLHQAKDKDGLARLTISKYQEHMASVVKKVYGELFRSPTLGAQKKAPVNEKPAPVVQGWAKVATRPNPQDILRTRFGKDGTTDEMISRGGAVLKSGKKVFWGAAPPQV